MYFSAQESHLTFLGWEQLTAALTSKWLELLRHLHRKESDNINALAKTLNRDCKNVHADVTMLEEAGLIVRDGTRLSAPWDTVTAKMAL
jgi:predicted transcriptional regulator